MRPRSLVIAALASALALSGAWMIGGAGSRRFLPSDSRAEWICFPTPVNGAPHSVTELDAVFRRTFSLLTAPARARLLMRSNKRVEITVNGSAVPLAGKNNWRSVSEVDLRGLLHAGENTIEARVFNDYGPPAFWAELTAEGISLRTDHTWDASFAGSAWRRAFRAADVQPLGRGHLLAGAESVPEVLPRVWRTWLGIFAAAAAAQLIAAAVARWWFKKTTARNWPASAALVAISLLWMALFYNNASQISRETGFDAKAHIAYVDYIQQRHAFPSPSEGFAMFHPPLYYTLSAAVLQVSGTSLEAARGVVGLRTLMLLFGIAHISAVFFAMRLLFPGERAGQVVGVAIAGFLPMQIYVSHYITNETLVASLVGCAIFLTLRLIRTPGGLVGHISLGAVLGAAMLAKATAVLAIPPILLALSAAHVGGRSPPRVWMRTIGAMLASAFAVCGWHYIGTWMRFGSPFVWSGAPRSMWWQAPGFRTSEDYTRFGRALVDPLFNSYFRFWDGIYSTVWGDGLCGAAPELAQRTPWNYDLMVAGYALALVPSALILTGAVVAVCRLVRKPTAELFLLVSFPAGLLMALIILSLRAASYSSVKGFYCLSALLPLAFFAAAGWEVVTRRHRIMRVGVSCLLAVWATNSFASFWIRESPANAAYTALRFQANGNLEAAVSRLRKAVDAAPSNTTNRRLLASLLDQTGESTAALQEANVAVNTAPDEGANYLYLAAIHVRQSRTDEAIEAAFRARDLAPENPFVYEPLTTLLLQSRRTAEAVDVARAGLGTNPFSAALHDLLAAALSAQNDAAEALRHRLYAQLLRENQP